MTMTDDNVVYIGNKPVMNYVLAVVTQFNNGAAEVSIKARGKAISRAVDAVEVSRNRFLPESKVKDIKIGTEKIATDRGETNVSIIEIVMTK
ncbi:MAG: DNA-binding protein Alba [Candidatus Methanoperedens sp.]|nr:DNA-binding protein Alba [Candidatus Methanoperedens sp.]